MSPTTVITIITASAAFVAAVAAFKQAKYLKFSLQLQAIQKLEETFSGQDFQRRRVSAADSLKTHPDEEIDDVLDFFDWVGYLLRRRALDKGMVWHTFFHWVQGYWSAAEGYIRQTRQEIPVIWEDLPYLYDQLTAIEKHRRKCSDADLTLSKDDVQEFLDQESILRDGTK